MPQQCCCAAGRKSPNDPCFSASQDPFEIIWAVADQRAQIKEDQIACDELVKLKSWLVACWQSKMKILFIRENVWHEE